MQTENNNIKKDSPNVIMLPPTLVLMHIAIGISLNWIMQWVFPLSFDPIWGILGLGLLMTAFGLTKWAKYLFEKAGTNVPPNKPALVIVKNGPYKITRNPMYLSFVIAFAGLCLMAGAPYMAIMIVPLAYLLDRHVIIPEEHYLAQKFGEQYVGYKNKTRRWI